MCKSTSYFVISRQSLRDAKSPQRNRQKCLQDHQLTNSFFNKLKKNKVRVTCLTFMFFKKNKDILEAISAT